MAGRPSSCRKHVGKSPEIDPARAVAVIAVLLQFFDIDVDDVDGCAGGEVARVAGSLAVVETAADDDDRVGILQHEICAAIAIDADLAEEFRDDRDRKASGRPSSTRKECRLAASQSTTRG